MQLGFCDAETLARFALDYLIATGICRYLLHDGKSQGPALLEHVRTDGRFDLVQNAFYAFSIEKAKKAGYAAEMRLLEDEINPA